MLTSLLIPINFIQAQTDSLGTTATVVQDSTATGISAITDFVQEGAMSLWDVVVSGGIIAYMLLFMLLVVVALIIMQLRTLNRAKKKFSHGTRNLIISNIGFVDSNGAKAACEKEDILLSRLLLPAFDFIKYGNNSLEKAVENQGKIEFHKREKYITWLGIISGFAPMLGFLGTVIGMIQAFNAMQGAEGTVSAADLASGISTAMVTTALGLITGICAYLAYHFLDSSLNKVMHNLEIELSFFVEEMKKYMCDKKENELK